MMRARPSPAAGPRSAAPRRAGFSLIELMVATAVLAVVVMYLTQTFITSQRTYSVVDQVSEAQQNLRIIGDLIERDLRLAGYMVPRQAAVCGVDNQNAPDVLYVSNADVILPVSDLETEASNSGNNGLLQGDFGAPINLLGAWPSGNGVNLNLQRDWVDVDPGAGNPGDFTVGQGVIVVDRDSGAGRSVCGTITRVSGNSLTVDFDTGAGPPGGLSDAVAVPAHVYRIVQNAGQPSQLVRDGVVLANDVEDLQFSLFVDLDDVNGDGVLEGDGLLDPGEFLGDTGDAVGDGVAVPYDATNVNNGQIRQVQISFAVTTREEDPLPEAPQQQMQVIGNRNPASIPAADQRRRRVHTTNVRVRNVNING